MEHFRNKCCKQPLKVAEKKFSKCWLLFPYLLEAKEVSLKVLKKTCRYWWCPPWNHKVGTLPKEILKPIFFFLLWNLSTVPKKILKAIFFLQKRTQTCTFKWTIKFLVIVLILKYSKYTNRMKRSYIFKSSQVGAIINIIFTTINYILYY